MSMDIVFKKRALTALLGVIFIVSLLGLTTSLFPAEQSDIVPASSETVISNEQNAAKSAIEPVTSEEEGAAAVQPSPSSVNADVDEGEDEDLVQVDTAPTHPDEWQAKDFGKLTGSLATMIEKNLRSHKILLTAVANGGMADYTLNWIESLKRTKQDDKFLVFAIDKELKEAMVAHGYEEHVVEIPPEWFHKQLSSDFAKWLDSSYTPITHAKTLVVERLLYHGVTVWFSDVDIVFTSPYIFDYLANKLTARKGGMTELLITQETEQKIVNSGFYLMRPSDTNKRILDDTIRIQDNEPKVTQQRAMNRVLDEMNLSYHDSPIALLDLALFPHGRHYFERNIPHKFGMEPMIVHANYRIGEEKKKSLQAANLWYL
ncbi:nucleotide-diphospho-sugar transferase-domain-containing protein [Syncephalastrum racemosum]|uniref:Nucleotide-diphospho-sugar transferase-domain-containing protein n=1 Tax=Syncephalastrum racemosum TaxID=13706 RepID=A0A1X2HSL6_SYNRA|nr:nucleotide-diphospho-sugar transferase-domain-containing protein [Syncephalastrum racemosum]